jgi:hypothetical protein
MSVLTDSVGKLTIEVDEEGETEWNSGLMSGEAIVRSPAVRIQTDDDHRPMVTVFTSDNLREESELAESVDLQWNDSADWTVDLKGREQSIVTIKRAAASVGVTKPDTETAEWRLATDIPKSSVDAISQALHAYEVSARRYGAPFSLMLERRTKATALILLATLFQVAAFVVVASRFRRWWPPALMASFLAWLGLSLFLGLNFLVQV